MIKQNIWLFLFIIIASSALITIDFYTIKTLSAVRAYINGESEYSKGQKDALLYLSTYIDTKEAVYFKSFNESISIPMGDNLARKSLLNHDNDEVISSYFLTGRNHPEDIPNMIWLFRDFKYSVMQKPIQLWTEAEPLINQLYTIGNEVRVKVEKNTLTEPDKLFAMRRISELSGDLYKKESEFSKVLGDTARKINTYLLISNILCILIIIGSIAIYAMTMISRLNASHQNIEVKNRELNEINKELDTFVYSVSHDLRSPITSIKGLIGILKEDNDPSTIREYISLMDEVIDKQDIFILEIIDFFKSKRSSLSFSEFSLKKMIGEVVANNKFSPLARDITIVQEIHLDKVYTDELRMKIIINNLISNAIKYSDEGKPDRKIFITTQKKNNGLLIEVDDNGIGIDAKYLNKIYDMFFVATNTNKGTGLGLYILMQNVEKLKGKVDVQSELNVGTKFTVSIPFADHGVYDNPAS